MSLRTGRYYMIINDCLLDKWTHKYLVADIRVLENHSYAYEGPWNLMTAISDSDSVIAVCDGDVYYYKDRDQDGRAVSSDELTLVTLSSVNLSPVRQ